MEILLKHWRFILFGFLTAFATHLGQTFFFSIFNESIRADFGLSNSSYGLIYMGATMTSGLLVARAGELIDHLPLKWWVTGLVLTMLCAAILFGLAPYVWVLALAIFLLRFTGQGLLSHTMTTSMARYFVRARGRALALAGFGYPVGEASLPLIALFLTTGLMMGWREAWITMCLMTVLIYLPLAHLLLGRAKTFGEVADGNRSEEDADGQSLTGVTRAQMLRGKSFWLLMPIVFVSSFTITGWFFLHQPVARAEGWPLELFATAFAAYAFANVGSNFGWGWLVDRLSAKQLIWAPALVLLLSQLLLLVAPTPAIAVLGGFALMGLGQGGMATVGNAIWAELFGRKHLGAIKAIAASVMIFGSAGAPFFMGLLLDAGQGYGALSLLCAALALLATITGFIISKRLAPIVRHGQV